MIHIKMNIQEIAFSIALNISPVFGNSWTNSKSLDNKLRIELISPSFHVNASFSFIIFF